MYLTMSEIKALDKEIISLNQLEEIEESEHVSFTECLGQSGVYTDCAWYFVELEDDTDIDVYIKIEDIYDKDCKEYDKDLEEYDNSTCNN